MKRTAAIFGIAGGLLLSYWLTTHIQERLLQSKARDQISIGKQPESETPRTPLHPEPGSLIARLEIPRIGLSVAVVEGAAEPQLRVAAGHIPGTAFPGENDNVAFAGHRDTHFRSLRSIRLNDEVRMAAGNRLYKYRVVSTRIVKPEDIQVLYPADRETLTLVTCYPFSYIGAAPSRFIVRAECSNCGLPAR